MLSDDKTLEMAIEYLNESRNPIHHTPIDLGIKEFKKVVRSTALNRKSQNKLIQGYKKRAWMEWMGVTRFRGTFPTHPKYGNAVEVLLEQSEDTIKVAHG